MVRQRRASKDTSAQDKVETPVSNNDGTTKERVKMATVLSSEEIAGLLANTRGRGEYAEYLKEFLDSGEPGIKVDLDGGILAGKSVDKAYTGLNNARTGVTHTKDAEGNIVSTAPKVAGADKVKVVRAQDKSAVFLINRSLVEGAQASDDEE
jgi:hypothetical protein